MLLLHALPILVLLLHVLASFWSFRYTRFLHFEASAKRASSIWCFRYTRFLPFWSFRYRRFLLHFGASATRASSILGLPLHVLPPFGAPATHASSIRCFHKTHFLHFEDSATSAFSIWCVRYTRFSILVLPLLLLAPWLVVAVASAAVTTQTREPVCGWTLH